MTKKLIASAIIALGFASEVNAQATASASITATIVTPISIRKTVDMNFGNAAVQVATGGTVVLTPAGTRTKTAGVTLPAVTGTVTAASFTVDGQANYTYAITLPATDITLTHTNAVDEMIVNTFTSTPATTGALDATGTQELNVGATLNVAANQLAGLYATGTNFDVTVNYN